MNSKNYNEYFGQAMNLLYSKYFGAKQDSDRNLSSEGEVANADSMDWEPVSNFFILDNGVEVFPQADSCQGVSNHLLYYQYSETSIQVMKYREDNF